MDAVYVRDGRFVSGKEVGHLRANLPFEFIHRRLSLGTLRGETNSSTLTAFVCRYGKVHYCAMGVRLKTITAALPCYQLLRLGNWRRTLEGIGVGVGHGVADDFFVVLA